MLGTRASSVKEYFRSQYKSNFVASSQSAGETWNKCSSADHPSTDPFKEPNLPMKKKRKSRWDD